MIAWGRQLSDHDLPERPAVTVAEAMGLGALEREGFRLAGLDVLLDLRRRARAGQVAGAGTEPQQERLRW